jgi:hypothetical protein
MKVCPVCGIEYSDKAEFCKKCETVLIDQPKPQEKVPTNYKRLFLMVLYTFIFIGFIALLYFLIGKGLLR